MPAFLHLLYFLHKLIVICGRIYALNTLNVRQTSYRIAFEEIFLHEAQLFSLGMQRVCSFLKTIAG